MDNTQESPDLKQLALLFLRLGTTAFGGPAAHIAMMEEETVKRRQWLTHEHFLDLLGATNLIPGPNSTEMAIHIGYLRAGWRGLIVAGVCFILPAVAITLVLANLYVAYGTLPHVEQIVSGIRPAVIALILAAVYRLSKPIMKNRLAIFIGVAVTVLSVAGVNEILLLVVAGLAGIIFNYRNQLNQKLASVVAFTPVMFVQQGSPVVQTIAGGPTLLGLGLFFLKIGSILYGSGYVLVAFLQSGLVESTHWLTQSQLFDAIAVGQFTPGPVLATATFIGYLILGFPGAGVATLGIFLPSFTLVLIVNPFIPKMRRSPLMRGFLDGVNAASLGLMLAVVLNLARFTLISSIPWLLFALSTAALVILELNAAWVILGAAAIGWLVSMFNV